MILFVTLYQLARKQLLNYRITELFKYGVNGLIATAIHFGVLSFNLKFIGIPSVGLANLIASCFGISTSFFGNRYFVFKRSESDLASQAIKFSGMYGVIALLHGFILLVWSDWFRLDYRIGFLIATIFQFILSYIGNKKMLYWE